MDFTVPRGTICASYGKELVRLVDRITTDIVGKIEALDDIVYSIGVLSSTREVFDSSRYCKSRLEAACVALYRAMDCLSEAKEEYVACASTCVKLKKGENHE